MDEKSEWMCGWVNERKGRNYECIRGISQGRLRINPVGPRRSPFPPSIGPRIPKVQYLHAGSLVCVLEAMPDRARHLRVRAGDDGGPRGLSLSPPPVSLPSRLGPNLEQHGGLHEVVSTKALVKASPFIVERNLGLGAEMKVSPGLPEDPGRL